MGDDLHDVKAAVLKVVAQADGPVTVAEVAARFGVAAPLPSRWRSSAAEDGWWILHDALTELRADGELGWITVEDDPEVVSPHQLIHWMAPG